MSSSTYSAEISPHKRLRQVVLLSGIVMSLIGVVVILVLPISVTGRAVAVVGWFFWSGRELLTYWRAYGRWRAYRLFADGEARVFGREERSTSPGSDVAQPPPNTLFPARQVACTPTEASPSSCSMISYPMSSIPPTTTVPPSLCR